MRQPALFLSHGAPTFMMEENATTLFWQSLPALLRKSFDSFDLFDRGTCQGLPVQRKASGTHGTRVCAVLLPSCQPGPAGQVDQLPTENGGSFLVFEHSGSEDPELLADFEGQER